jgi:protoporphyrinogen/coproporphyrinogen III oxidase
MKPVVIVGAGFSGLTLAYHLRRKGVGVRLFEIQDRAGGMLNTQISDFGLTENAANAILNDIEIERLFEDLNVPFASQRPERTNRFIFWKRPTRWPLTVATSAKLIWVLGKVKLGSPEVMPKESETIHEWSRRVVNAEFEERLLTPALQGVFAGDPKRLSARMTLSALFTGRAPAGRIKGSVAPTLGMNQLMQALRHRLEADGVGMQFNYDFDLKDFEGETVVLCTSAWTAAEIVRESHPELSEQLRHCEGLPLVSATCVFENAATDLKGFGCLFPASQGFQAAGVVFNDCVFDGRSKLRSETWILGGALQLGAVKWSDDEILSHILKDRARLMPGAVGRPLDFKVSRWPRAIPHYTVQWEKFVKDLKVERPLFLHGNYLGAIGLSRIHRSSMQLAEKIKDVYGS